MGCCCGKGIDVQEGKDENNLNKIEGYDIANTQGDENINVQREEEKEEIVEMVDLNETPLNDTVITQSIKEKEQTIQNIIRSPKKKIRKKGEYPYIIKKKKGYLELTIFADCFNKENTLRIWAKQGKYIKFKVKGKWKIGPKFEETTSVGIPSSYSLGFNYGALVGRIGSSEPFLVKDQLVFFVQKSGPLYLRMNLPKNIKTDPSGKLILNIYDVELITIDELNSRINWIESENIIDKFENQDDIEYDLITLLNNLRMNPALFYEKHIEDYKNMIITKDYLNYYKNGNFEPFFIYQKATNILNKFFEQNIREKNTFIQGVSLELTKLEKGIYEYLGNNIGNSNFILRGKTCKRDNSLEICLQYLFDEDFRNYIFDRQYTKVAVKIIKNYFNEECHLNFICLFKGK